jgi:hypothetical protein
MSVRRAATVCHCNVSPLPIDCLTMFKDDPEYCNDLKSPCIGAGEMKIIPKTARILLVIMILAALDGCALFKLREDVKISKDSCLLFGEVLNSSKRQKPIIVVAYSRSGEAVQIADYAVLSQPGEFVPPAPPGLS